MFKDYSGDPLLCSRSERSESVNIRDLLRIECMLKVFNFLHGCCSFSNFVKASSIFEDCLRKRTEVSFSGDCSCQTLSFNCNIANNLRGIIRMPYF